MATKRTIHMEQTRKPQNKKHTRRGDEYRLLVAEVVKVDVVHEGIITSWRGWKWGVLPGSPPDWLLSQYQLEKVLLDLLHTTSPATLPLDVSKGHPLLGLHAVEALIICSHLGVIFGLVSRELMLELEMMLEELLILEIQLLELVSEVVDRPLIAHAFTPILESFEMLILAF
ncbi:unnamed protein product [Linum trigynum]|uniref:Uncharacterized protein n=1 Tax=Linum trigynum TaxID=586398 RepID=A0AAV2GB47_9ROSI